ncbi:MAG TPA: lipid II flippase MurJ [Candidatus Saccharibacteria bacterium]|nr:lipid II flippase MurJ [Candidatus Saccharibacteria bacterium]
MNRFLGRANKRLSLGSAAMLLAGSAFIGTILGILRTKLINANFNNFESDAYFAAFKIPDFVFFTLASGALGVAFLPILSERLQKNKQSAWEVSSYVLNALAVVAFISSVLIMVFARPLLSRVVAPGFTSEQMDLTVAIMRIISVNIFLFAISTVLTTLQQALGRFFFAAIAPLFYNGCIIASIFIFGPSIGIVGLGLGVAIGAVLQLMVVALGLVGTDFRYRPKIDFKNKSFMEIIRILPARSIDQGIDYINGIVETRFASRLNIGAVTNYENALLLHNAPIMLVGTAIATAAFPRLTDRLAQGRTDLFRKEFIRVLCSMIWIALPVVVVSYFARAYLARIIFARSNREIALIFGFLCISIFFRIMYAIISRYFYAHKDTKTPLYVSLFVILLNIYLAYTWARPSSYGVVGLALAQATVAIVEIVVLTTVMVVRDRKIFDMVFFKFLTRVISVTGFTVAAAYLTVQFLPLSQQDLGFIIVAKLTFIALVVFVVHTLISYMFGLSEAIAVKNRVKNIITKPVKI